MTEEQKKPVFAPGVYTDIPEDVYHRSEGISNSFLSSFITCPAETQEPDEETAPMALGSAAHILVLEGEKKFEESVIEADAGTITAKNYVKTKVQNPDKVVVLRDQIELCHEIYKSIQGHPTAMKILNDPNNRKELSCYHQKKGSSILQRCRVDIEDVQHKTLFDLKLLAKGKCNNQKFFWEVKDRYARQAGWYVDTYTGATGNPIDYFVFMVVETKPPYKIGLFPVNDEWIKWGYEECELLLPRVAECKKTGVWPNYNEAGFGDEIEFPAYLRP